MGDVGPPGEPGKRGPAGGVGPPGLAGAQVGSLHLANYVMKKVVLCNGSNDGSDDK